MRVILASSEVVPYSKTGGLGDVAGALPQTLSRIGCDISVVTPRYTGFGKRHGDVVSHETGEMIFDDLLVPFSGAVKSAADHTSFRKELNGTPKLAAGAKDSGCFGSGAEARFRWQV